MAKPIPGMLTIDNTVIADLAGYAALESYGVVGMAMPSLTDGVAKILPAARLRRGIQVVNTDDGVVIDLYVVIESGVNLSTVCRNLSDNVRYALTSFVKLDIAAVNVHVQGIRVRD